MENLVTFKIDITYLLKKSKKNWVPVSITDLLFYRKGINKVQPTKF